MGGKIPLGDCEALGATIGNLRFRVIDFGDTVRISERSRIRLENIDVQERNLCVLLHTVSGAQWDREGDRNGFPTLARVLADEEEWLREEYTQAKKDPQAVGKRTDLYAMDVASVAHDAVNGGHDRDYRGFSLFPMIFLGGVTFHFASLIREVEMKEATCSPLTCLSELIQPKRKPRGSTLLHTNIICAGWRYVKTT